MINYGQVKSSFRPQNIEITSDKVFIASNIEEYQEIIDDKTVNGYTYNYTCYNKDEYILLMAQSSASIEELREELEAAKILLGVE